MTYGVIVCPKCKLVKGVNLSFKTSKCFKCNNTIALDKIKILYKTNSEEKLRQAIGLVNAELDGNLEKFKKTL